MKVNIPENHPLYEPLEHLFMDVKGVREIHSFREIHLHKTAEIPVKPDLKKVFQVGDFVIIDTRPFDLCCKCGKELPVRVLSHHRKSSTCDACLRLKNNELPTQKPK